MAFNRNKLLVFAFLIDVLVQSSIAAFPNGRVYPFPITNLLTCRRFNDQGQIVPVSDVPQYVPLVPAPSGQLWLPEPSGFLLPRIPTNQPTEESLEQRLLRFLGADLNRQLQSTVDLSGIQAAPRACDLIPTLDGSVSLIQAGATWSESERETTRARFRIEVEPELDGGQIIRLRSTTIEVIDRFRDNINPFPELCDVHVSQCPLVTVWGDLGRTYFPRFVAAGLCSGKNCSFPRAQTCDPDIRNNTVTSVVALRWDCCFNPAVNIYRSPIWECGWRKVRFVILCDCRCGCGLNIDLQLFNAFDSKH